MAIMWGLFDPTETERREAHIMPRRKARQTVAAIVAADTPEGELYTRYNNLDPDAVVILTPSTKTIPAHLDVSRVITTRGIRTNPERVRLIALARGRQDVEPQPGPPTVTDDTDDDDD